MKKKYLLTRFGGMGDLAPVMVTAKLLKQKGYEVHIAAREDDHGNKQVDFLQNTDCCDKAMTFKEIGPWKTRCVSFKHGWVDVRSIYSDYDEVIDFMHVIEYNDKCRTSFINNPMDEWKKHRNSNWVNWYDLHLSWANIDPTSVTDNDKRPVFVLSDEEREEIENIRKDYSEVFVLNPHASSLARTWYQSNALIKELLKTYENPIIFNWRPDISHWEAHTASGVSKYTSNIKSPLRASMCVVGAADVYIGADTGFTHVAEGLEIPHIAVYSSVPWWTRAKYYKYQIPIDKGYHTFSLTLGDPNRIQEGMDSLSKKEKKLLDFHASGMSIYDAAEKLNTTPEGVDMEMQALQKKIESFERIQSKSLSEVTVKEVLDRVKHITAKEVLK